MMLLQLIMSPQRRSRAGFSRMDHTHLPGTIRLRRAISCGQVSIALNIILILQHLLANSPIATSTNFTPSPSGTSSPSSSSSNGGAIAGGVVGGIAGLALIAGLLWFFLRRWKQSRPQAHSMRLMEHVLEKLGSPRSELPSDNDNAPLAKPVRSQDAPHELPNTSMRTDGARHEMQS